MNNQPEVRRYTRSRSKRQMLNVDLNAVPPSENRDHDGNSNSNRQAVQEVNAMMPPPIDVEALVDDDVIISSPSAFAEAKNKNNSRRNRRTVVVDVESEEMSRCNKRKKVPTNQTIINCDLYINLEGSSNSTRKSGQSEVITPAPPPLPPKEPTFSCPICMGPLVEEMTTKCGHIFCKACIKAVIAVQTKCPTCRRRTTVKDIIRVYLPSTRSS